MLRNSDFAEPIYDYILTTDAKKQRIYINSALLFVFYVALIRPTAVI